MFVNVNTHVIILTIRVVWNQISIIFLLNIIPHQNIVKKCVFSQFCCLGSSTSFPRRTANPQSINATRITSLNPVIDSIAQEVKKKRGSGIRKNWFIFYAVISFFVFCRFLEFLDVCSFFPIFFPYNYIFSIFFCFSRGNAIFFTSFHEHCGLSCLYGKIKTKKWKFEIASDFSSRVKPLGTLSTFSNASRLRREIAVYARTSTPLGTSAQMNEWKYKLSL